MQAWRLCRAAYADLSGQGARLAGGRWNSPGRPVVYLADHPALCVLEVRVHLDLPPDLLPADYTLLRVDFGDLTAHELKPPLDDARALGNAWLAGKASPLLRVPSFLVPRCWNLLLNPAHPAAASARIAETIPYQFDGRLWS